MDNTELIDIVFDLKDIIRQQQEEINDLIDKISTLEENFISLKYTLNEELDLEV